MTLESLNFVNSSMACLSLRNISCLNGEACWGLVALPFLSNIGVLGHMPRSLLAVLSDNPGCPSVGPGVAGSYPFPVILGAGGAE